MSQRVVALVRTQRPTVHRVLALAPLAHVRRPRLVHHLRAQRLRRARLVLGQLPRAQRLVGRLPRRALRPHHRRVRQGRVQRKLVQNLRVHVPSRVRHLRQAVCLKLRFLNWLLVCGARPEWPFLVKCRMNFVRTRSLQKMLIVV